MLKQPIGGFFGLELPPGGRYPPGHKSALPLNTGRACFRLILQITTPSIVYLPYYSCGTLDDVLKEENIPYTYYFLDNELMPESFPELPSDGYFLYINYFALHNKNVERLYERYGNRLIIDNVQAYYNGSFKDCWSFNSVRKFFGVPDGAYLYGPSLPATIKEQNTKYNLEYLVYRALGENEIAYELYKEEEQRIGTGIYLMSEFSSTLLRSADHPFAIALRINNFVLLHESLGSINRFPGLDNVLDTTPFFYPFLPDKPISRARLIEQKLFIPQYWPERAGNAPAGSMDERLINELLPLPIDQRYDAPEMKEIIQIIQHEYQGQTSHHQSH